MRPLAAFPPEADHPRVLVVLAADEDALKDVQALPSLAQEPERFVISRNRATVLELAVWANAA